MRVNLNTQNYGYTNSQKANKTPFGATLKPDSLSTVATEVLEHIGGTEVKNMLSRISASTAQIQDLKADGSDFAIEYALKISKICDIGGRSSIQLTPTASSTLKSGEVVKKVGESLSNKNTEIGKKLGVEFVTISSKLAETIENSRTFIEAKAKAVEEAINNGVKAVSENRG